MASYDSVIESIVKKLSYLLAPVTHTRYGFMSPKDKQKLDAINKANIIWATCETRGDQQFKELTIDPEYADIKIKTGDIIYVKYTYTNTRKSLNLQSITMNIPNNGSYEIFDDESRTTVEGARPDLFGKANNWVAYRVVEDVKSLIHLGHSWTDDNTNANTEESGFVFLRDTSASVILMKDHIITYLSQFKPATGSIITVYFANDVLARSSININNTGDIPIFYRNAVITDGVIKAGDTVTMVYTGTYYCITSIDRGFESAVTTSSQIDILDEDPTDPPEGYMWIKKS